MFGTVKRPGGDLWSQIDGSLAGCLMLQVPLRASRKLTPKPGLQTGKDNAEQETMVGSDGGADDDWDIVSDEVKKLG